MATINAINANQLLGTSASPSFVAVTASSGDLTATSGNVVATGGSVTAGGGSIVAGAGSTATGAITLKNATNANNTIIQSGVATASVTYTLPTAAPVANGYQLVSTTGGVMSWVAPADTASWSVITADQSAAVDKGYITNKAGTPATITLPTTAAVGTVQEIAGLGATGWILAQNALQSVHFGTSTTTVGTGGSLASTQANDSIRLVCAVADTTWIVVSSIGNITVV